MYIYIYIYIYNVYIYIYYILLYANPISTNCEISWLDMQGMQTLCCLGLGRTYFFSGSILVCVLFSSQIGKRKRKWLATCMLHVVKNVMLMIQVHKYDTAKIYQPYFYDL